MDWADMFYLQKTSIVKAIYINLKDCIEYFSNPDTLKRFSRPVRTLVTKTHECVSEGSVSVRLYTLISLSTSLQPDYSKMRS